METNRNGKVIAIVALIVAVLGLSLGFAAYSQNLVIESSATATGATDSSFKILFDKNSTGTPDSQTTAQTLAGVANGGATASDATISGTTISGLQANFTGVNQTVTYTFYVRNLGQFKGYLNTVTFGNATGTYTNGTSIACSTDATDLSADAIARIENVCNKISYKVSVNSEEYTATANGLSGKLLAVDGNHPVVVTISYTGTATDISENDINVSLGDITLTYDLND